MNCTHLNISISFIFTLIVSINSIAKIEIAPLNYEKNKSLTAEQKCTSVDYEKELGPVRNQRKYGNCYAHTDADLISHALGVKPPAQVSALDVTTNYYNFNISQINELSPFEKQFLLNKQSQTTLEEHSKNNESSTEAIDQLAGGDAVKSTLIMNTRKYLCAAEGTDDLDFEEEVQKLQNVITTQREKGNTDCPQQGEFKVIKTSAHVINDIVAERISRNCKKIPFNNSLVAKSYKGTPQQLIEHMNRQLDLGNIVGISYYPAFMRKKDDGDHARHASSIIGRKYENGKCWYKLRNSWGPTCDAIKSKETRCGSSMRSRDVTCTNYDYTDQIKCVHGGAIWINQDSLAPALIKLAIVEKLAIPRATKTKSSQ